MSTYTESFNKTDSSTLGPDLTWTETNNDLQVVSNQCDVVSLSVACRARAESDCATDDNYSQWVIAGSSTTNTNLWSVLCRFQSGATTAYGGTQGDGGTLNNTILRKIVTGTATTLGTSTHTKATNDVIRMQAVGSTIKLQFNGADNISLTDTAITTGKRGGVQLSAAATGRVLSDSFEMGDTAVSATATPAAVVITGTAVGPSNAVAAAPAAVVITGTQTNPAASMSGAAPAAVVITGTQVGPGGSPSALPAAFVITGTAVGPAAGTVTAAPAAVVITGTQTSPTGSVIATPAAVVITLNSVSPAAFGSGNSTATPAAVIVTGTQNHPSGSVSVAMSSVSVVAWDDPTVTWDDPDHQWDSAPPPHIVFPTPAGSVAAAPQPVVISLTADNPTAFGGTGATTAPDPFIITVNFPTTSATNVAPTTTTEQHAGGYWRQPPDIRIERERKMRDDEDLMVLL